MATEKQVQTLAKKMALLIGKMDIDAINKEFAKSQEATNIEVSKELLKKSREKD